MIEMGSGPIQKAMARMTAQPVKVAVTKEDTMANGTALAALDASSAMVADDSKPLKGLVKMQQSKKTTIFT